MGVTGLGFELWEIKTKIKDVLAGHIVTMVTMIGHFYDTIIVASLVKLW